MIKSIFSLEGIPRGFYKGITLNLIKVKYYVNGRVHYRLELLGQ